MTSLNIKNLSQDDQRTLKAFNLEQLAKTNELPEPGSEVLQFLQERVGGGLTEWTTDQDVDEKSVPITGPNGIEMSTNMAAYYKQIGATGFSDLQWSRLLKLEQRFNNFGTSVAAKARQPRIKRIKELFGKDFKIKPSLLKTLLESDEALDKFITEQGLLESK